MKRRRFPVAGLLAKAWWTLLLTVLAAGLPGQVHAIENTASGSVGSSYLDTASATVTLNRLNVVVDPGNSTVTVSPANIPANGTSMSTITVVLRDADNQPVSGRAVSISTNRGGVDVITQPASPTDAAGTVTGTINSSTPGVTTVMVTDDASGIVLDDQPQILFTQGMVLDLVKTANKEREVVGGVVTYTVEIRNLTSGDVRQVRIDDAIPPNFKYARGSARLDGVAMADPTGNRPATFNIGTVPAFADSNGNREADPGEPGYMVLSYQLIIGSGAGPGDYDNTAVAWDATPQSVISNSARAGVTVVMDPLFDLGTIIGKVFEDRNGDGLQDKGEEGIAGAVVVLDDGTSVSTDKYGRYHIPAVKPGHRLLKIDQASLPAGAVVVGDVSKIVSVTPGLLVKANFGIRQERESQSIGRAPGLGLLVDSQSRKEPVQIQGSVNMLRAIVNGVNAGLHSSEVLLELRKAAETVTITGGELSGPLQFSIQADEPDRVREWKLTVTDSEGKQVKTLGQTGPVPDQVTWSGITADGHLIGGGDLYRYQVQVWYQDGTYSASPVRTFGVNQKSFVSVNLSGSGFDLGSARLRSGTRKVLADVAKTLRKYPNEVIIIEGHTDSEGSEELNIRLSKKRAEAAWDYLVKVQGLSSERFVLQWYGEARPVASNEIPEGRELNRRVEIKGQLLKVKMSQLLQQYRAQPRVVVNDVPADVGKDGRFITSVGDVGKEGIKIDMRSPTGARAEGRVPIPDLEILEPRGERRLGCGDSGEGYRVGVPGPGGVWEPGEKALTYRLKGRTDPQNTVTLSERNLVVNEDGTFTADLELAVGEKNTFGLLVRNPEGYIRIARVAIRVSDIEDDGSIVLVRDPVPNLTVHLPPEGGVLFNSRLTVTGFTDQGNRVRVNGRDVTVREDGSFTAQLDLVDGENRIKVQVTDPNGYTGEIQRTLNLSGNRLFFLAFADGKFGQLKGKGYLDGAGMKNNREFYQEGRVAYYLKGTIAGKYIITSAFDSGTGRFGEMFKNLDEGDRERFFTNLDPDKYYPVYGDASDITHNVKSQGKFYLALDSRELSLLVGNYVLNLSDTELAAYQRTLYGGKLEYRSLAKSKYGEHNTTVVLFGAQARDVHIMDELRGTGGSLYYLSRREVTEGSEQVTLVVRDKSTGLTLAEIPQRRNADYRIRYEAGRLVFNRPIASVVSDDSLIDNALLSGDPVYVRVDYEVKAGDLERTSKGGRVKKQLGDHVSIGGTYVADKLESGSYDLSGVDAKVRLSGNSWVSAETARTKGSDSPVFLSGDGGLTYTKVPASSIREGDAYKAAAELDIGELFGSPQRLRVGGYFKRLEPGFQSGANHSEEGVKRYGANFSLVLSGTDTVLGRYDWKEGLDPALLGPGVESDSETGRLQWVHRLEKHRLTLEYKTHESRDSTGSLLENTSLAAARLDLYPGEKLSAHLEQQTTLTGPENDQTTAGVLYQVSSAFSLGATGTHGTKGDAMQGEANLKVGGSRLYATERRAEDSAGQNNTTVLGTESAVDPSTRVYTENQWESRDGSADRQVSLLGLRRDWDLGKGLSAILSGEVSRIEAEAEKSSRYAVSTGVSYKNPSGMEASVKGEVRREKGSIERVQYLTANQLKIMLSPDYSILGRYNFSVTRDLDLDEVLARYEERSIGLAYRPVESDRLNLLSRYTELKDLAPDTLDDTETSDTLSRIMSIEWSYDLTPRLEWVEKEAMRRSEEVTGDRDPIRTSTFLSIHRLNYNIVTLWDIGMEYRLRSVDETKDQQTGWLTEVMYRLGDHFRIGIGYNFTDFSDNEFSENEYSVRGTFLRVQGKY